MTSLDRSLQFIPREGDSPERTNTALFAYKARILKLATSSLCREFIFAARGEIAAVFRQYGGERHEGTAILFESLRSPDSLKDLAIGPSRADEVREEQRHHNPGFFVFPDFVDAEGVRAIQRDFPKGKGVGQQMVMTWKGFLYAPIRDNRPIYIRGPVTEELFRRLYFIISLRPELAERIKVMEGSGEGSSGFKFTPYSQAVVSMNADFPLVVSGFEERRAAMDKLADFLFEKPKAGEIYRGVVTKVMDFGVFIGIKPQAIGGRGGLVTSDHMMEGLVHISQLDKSHLDDREMVGVNEGDEMVVEVIDCDDMSGRIRLSERRAHESIDSGTPLTFDFRTVMKELPV
ncbi:MAG: polynucleotide phosphorylase/polyadenylase, polyribonucleotide nucleotidyltransferase [Candidatus Peregrinibacteria bacterium GW2011_GWF2_38_29]|nr:MAG: polynucleotide phosphorylase/polyadenylase, polyribonucleotide nucleotidyltransferase [Candidatus Peregrinibacteria bacterium GW2011_GWF2_38_29]HBB02469.1 hypothetical protein [Candidatus Peregrinibacteria bacterium]